MGDLVVSKELESEEDLTDLVGVVTVLEVIKDGVGRDRGVEEGWVDPGKKVVTELV